MMLSRGYQKTEFLSQDTVAGRLMSDSAKKSIATYALSKL